MPNPTGIGGRPRKPTALKVLAGTNRADRENPLEPQFTPAKPGDFDNPFDIATEKVAHDEWNRLCPELLRVGLLNVANVQTFVAMCRALQQIRACEQKIADEGLFVHYPMFSRKTGEQT